MFKLIPVYKEYLWGGTKLKSSYGKHSELPILAESWELSTHQDGTSFIEVEDKKIHLKAYVQQYGKSVLGSNALVEDEIPILVKLIDAKAPLSVQVHPDDSYAMHYENSVGKTEMWYVLEAEPGAKLVYGFEETLTPQTFKAHIDHHTLETVLHFVEVHKGDVFFIEPGTIHAIGKGIVIAEIQQCSNITYRVYDYGRIGVDGKPRPLHIDKALQVTNLEGYEASEIAATSYLDENPVACLAKCKYFTVQRIRVDHPITLEADALSFHSILVTEGHVTLKNQYTSIDLVKGESAFIPAHTGEYSVDGTGEVILSTL